MDQWIASPDRASARTEPALAKSLSLLHATLYGLGVTIGAGIYVLIGAAAARAGMHAPLAFVAAALLMALSAASFAELAGTPSGRRRRGGLRARGLPLRPAGDGRRPAGRGDRHRRRGRHQRRQRRIRARVHPAAGSGAGCGRRARHGHDCGLGRQRIHHLCRDHDRHRDRRPAAAGLCRLRLRRRDRRPLAGDGSNDGQSDGFSPDSSARPFSRSSPSSASKGSPMSPRKCASPSAPCRAPFSSPSPSPRFCTSPWYGSRW